MNQETVSNESLYGVLEVSANATFEEIENAYERIMAYLAVDSMAMYSLGVDPEEIADQRARVEEAFRVLRDPQLRAAYDGTRESGDDSGYPAIVVPDSAAEGGTSMTLGELEDDFAQRFEEPYPEDYQGEYEDDQPDGLAEFGGVLEAATHQSDDFPTPNVRQAADTAATVKDRTAPEHPLATEDRQAAGTDPAVAKPAAASSAAEPVAEKKREPSGPPPPKILPAGVRDRVTPRRLLTPTIDQPVINDDTEIAGGLLKRLRESCGASLEEVATATKVNKRYLRAIEENDYDVLPAKVYVRGFVHEYARVLGLDPKLVARGYLKRYARYREGASED